MFSVSLLGRSSAGAGPSVRNLIRHSSTPAPSAISRSYVASLGQSSTEIRYLLLFPFYTPPRPLNRHYPQAEKIIAEEQVGFRSGMITIDLMFNTRILCEQYFHQQNNI